MEAGGLLGRLFSLHCGDHILNLSPRPQLQTCRHEASVGGSLQREVRIVDHGAMTRLVLSDGSELAEGRSTWRPVDRKTLLWWISQGNPIADWLLAHGIDP